MKNIIALTLTFLLSIAAFAAEQLGPTWSIAGAPQKKRDSEVYLKIMNRNGSGSTPYSYHGLVIYNVSGMVNSAYLPIPDDYELAFEFIKDEKNTKRFYVLVSNVKTVQLRTRGAWTNASQGVVTLNNGTEFVANSLGFVPHHFCPKNVADLNTHNCILGYGGGTLFDERTQQVYSNAQVYVSGTYDQIEVVSDSTAKATFERYIAAFDKRNQDVRNSEDTWRRAIAEGTMTTCGMVIERRSAIVSVQTTQGVKWFRLDQLKQPGSSSSCN